MTDLTAGAGSHTRVSCAGSRRMLKRVLAPALFFSALAATSADAQQTTEGAFVMLMGADTFAVENFTRTSDKLTSEINGAAVGRLGMEATIREDQLLSEVTLRAWLPGSDLTNAAAQDVTLTLGQDAVTAVRAGNEAQQVPTRPDATIYVNPSMLLVEQVIVRAKVIGGPNVEVPLFLAQGGQTLNSYVRFTGSDSASVMFGGVEMRAHIDAEGRMLGARIPAQGMAVVRSNTQVAIAAPKPIDYSAPADAPYRAEDVRISATGGHVLAGTLTRPRESGRVPAVVLITGSGAQERDQTIGLEGYRPFREIADALSRRGFAVLRMDDRGWGASTGNFAAATTQDFAQDIADAVNYLRNRPDIDVDDIALLGHSEGGIIAPMVAEMDPRLKGIVLISGSSDTGREILAYQQRMQMQTSGSVPEAALESALDAAARQMEEAAAQQPWLRFFLDYDPKVTARKITRVPVLIVHGETDRQVTVDQAEKLAAAFREGGNDDVTVQLFPGINHLMLSDPNGSPMGYASLQDVSVNDEMLETIGEWLDDKLD